MEYRKSLEEKSNFLNLSYFKEIFRTKVGLVLEKPQISGEALLKILLIVSQNLKEKSVS